MVCDDVPGEAARIVGRIATRDEPRTGARFVTRGVVSRSC
jgi:hypothetical protein